MNSTFSQPYNDSPAYSLDYVTHLASFALTLDADGFETVRSSVPVGHQQAFDVSVMAQRMTGEGAENDRRKRLLDGELEKLEIRDEAKRLHQQNVAKAQREEVGAHEQVMVDGADFLLDTPVDTVAVWGDGDDVILADGEALMIVGKAGVGKTTIVNQFIRARLGVTDKALGYSVVPSKANVLYLACDRPRQAARAMRRLFGPEDRAALSRLRVWQGPPPVDLALNTTAMLNMALEAGADTVIVDSLKDVAIGLSEDAVGSAYNRARQLCLVNGITVIELHHQVKRGQDGKSPNTIADVYGSTWLTAGAGSVLLVDGDAGDPMVTLKHLKQPINEIGPVEVLHDHETGVSTVAERADLAMVARTRVLTAHDAAVILFDTDKPSRAQKEKARRKLEALVRIGDLRVISDGQASGTATTYGPANSWTPEQPTDSAADALFGDA